MQLWEVSFRTQYDYPFIEMSSRYPETTMSLWCLYNRELFQVPTQSKKVLDNIEAELKKGGWVIEKWGDAYGGRTFFLKDTCDRWESVWNICEPMGGLITPPLAFNDGWCYGRFLSFDEDVTRSMFKALQNKGRAELISKRELSLSVLPTNIWVHSLFSDLTQKQADSLLKAHKLGYYVSPRKVGTEDVAKNAGISRSTFEEHLRKAENRVMDALIPYLQLYAQGQPNPERLPAEVEIPSPAAAED